MNVICTEKEYKTDIENMTIHLIKYSDEEEITMNIIQNKKLKMHKELNKDDTLYQLFKLEYGEKMTGLNKTIECVNINEDIIEF